MPDVWRLFVGMVCAGWLCALPRAGCVRVCCRASVPCWMCGWCARVVCLRHVLVAGRCALSVCVSCVGHAGAALLMCGPSALALCPSVVVVWVGRVGVVVLVAV